MFGLSDECVRSGGKTGEFMFKSFVILLISFTSWNAFGGSSDYINDAFESIKKPCSSYKFKSVLTIGEKTLNSKKVTKREIRKALGSIQDCYFEIKSGTQLSLKKRSKIIISQLYDKFNQLSCIKVDGYKMTQLSCK